jgi:hypothetical protein
MSIEDGLAMVQSLKLPPIRFRMGRLLLVCLLASIPFGLLFALLSKWTGIQHLGVFFLVPWVVLLNILLNWLARSGMVRWLVREE